MSYLDHRQAKILINIILRLLQIASNTNTGKTDIVQFSFLGLITDSIRICHNKPTPKDFLSVSDMHLPSIAIFPAGLARTSWTAFLRMTRSLLFWVKLYGTLHFLYFRSFVSLPHRQYLHLCNHYDSQDMWLLRLDWVRFSSSNDHAKPLTSPLHDH